MQQLLPAISTSGAGGDHVWQSIPLLQQLLLGINGICERSTAVLHQQGQQMHLPCHRSMPFCTQHTEYFLVRRTTIQVASRLTDCTAILWCQNLDKHGRRSGNNLERSELCNVVQQLGDADLLFCRRLKNWRQLLKILQKERL